MKDITVEDILKITGGKLITGNKEIVCENFSKDTRTIQKGDIYIGIKGEKFDGNSFWKQALENGANVVIVENVEISKEVCIIYQLLQLQEVLEKQVQKI